MKQDNDVAVSFLEMEIETLRRDLAVTRPRDGLIQSQPISNTPVLKDHDIGVSEIAEQLREEKGYKGLFRKDPALATAYAKVLHQQWQVAVRSGTADHWTLLDARMGYELKENGIPRTFVEKKMREMDTFARENGFAGRASDVEKREKDGEGRGKGRERGPRGRSMGRGPVR